MSGNSPSPEELRERFAILSRVAILFTVPDNFLRALARQLQPAVAAKGSTIIKQGDRGDSLFIIEEGRCEVTVEEGPHHSMTIALLGSGDFFGEMALISEEPRAASVKALEDCKLLVLDRRTLFSTLPPESDAFIDMQKLVEQRKAELETLAYRSRVVASDESASTIAFYSPKGGAGRTTLALNLAAHLARKHPGEVLLVDLSLPFNHAALTANLVPTSCLAHTAQADQDSFDELLLSSILHHPGKLMLLPGVLRPEESELITPDLISRAMGVLGNAFRYIVFDLGVQMSETTLRVLEDANRIVLVATPELSSLKDISDLLRIFENILHIAPGRVVLTLNTKSPKAAVSKEDVERSLKLRVTCEYAYDGSKPEEAAVRGEILVLSDPKSAITRGTMSLSQMLESQNGEKPQ